MGYDYDISYKKGKENVVTDALSRLHNGKLMAIVISSIFTNLIQEIQKSWKNDPYIKDLISQLRDHNLPYSTYV